MKVEDNHETVTIELTYEEAEQLHIILHNDVKTDPKSDLGDFRDDLEDKLDEYINT